MLLLTLTPNQSQQMAVPEPELRIYKQIKIVKIERK